MADKKGHKQFPFAWRGAWLKLFQESPTAAAVWAYMFWRSDKDNVFDLCEGLMCHDLNLNPKTLGKARSLIHAKGGFKRECERNERGQLVVRYRMLDFSEPSPEIYLTPTPNIGGESLPQKTDVDPSPSLRRRVKRGHTVDTYLSIIPDATVDTEETDRQTDRRQEPAALLLPFQEEEKTKESVIKKIKPEHCKRQADYLCTRFDQDGISRVLLNRVLAAHPEFTWTSYNLCQLDTVLDRPSWKKNIKDVGQFAFRWDSSSAGSLYSQVLELALLDYDPDESAPEKKAAAKPIPVQTSVATTAASAKYPDNSSPEAQASLEAWRRKKRGEA